MDNGDQEIVTGKYMGNTMCGFVEGNMYAVRVSRGLYGYTVEELSEELDSSDTALIRYASVGSFNRNWELIDG